MDYLSVLPYDIKRKLTTGEYSPLFQIYSRVIDYLTTYRYGLFDDTSKGNTNKINDLFKSYGMKSIAILEEGDVNIESNRAISITFDRGYSICTMSKCRIKVLIDIHDEINIDILHKLLILLCKEGYMEYDDFAIVSGLEDEAKYRDDVITEINELFMDYVLPYHLWLTYDDKLEIQVIDYKV